MKILIWFLCIFANAVITTIIKENGVILGAIPTVILYLATIGLARVLCKNKKWDKHKSNKANNQKVPVQTTSSVVDNVSDKISFCRKCGEKLIDSSRFCRKCGTEIVDIQKGID